MLQEVREYMMTMRYQIKNLHQRSDGNSGVKNHNNWNEKYTRGVL